jgi:hypothetical protein
MISAGGNNSQAYRPEYIALKSRRSCTWCRPGSLIYQEVKATFAVTGGVNLHNPCLGAH